MRSLARPSALAGSAPRHEKCGGRRVSLFVMKVTVGIPTFNRSGFLAQAIESVLNQTYHDFTLVICDNASDDDTAEVVHSYDDSRIVYRRHSINIGLNPNFNDLIKNVETESVVVLPDDDLLYPDYLGTVVAVLASHPKSRRRPHGVRPRGPHGEIVKRDIDLVGAGRPVAIESTEQFLERSMSTWMVNWASALFRTEAIRGAGALAEGRTGYGRAALLSHCSRLGFCRSRTFIGCHPVA